MLGKEEGGHVDSGIVELNADQTSRHARPSTVVHER
jgi:hypothetical protein